MKPQLQKRSDGAVAAPKPDNEADRLGELHGLCILVTGKDERFDRITRLVSEVLDVPIVLVSLVDESREWFKSTIGTEIVEIERDHGFCAHGILQNGTNAFTVLDALDDERFATHPFVAGGPMLRFYSGAPLISEAGHKIGMLCLHDIKPRPDFGEHQQQLLKKFAAITMDEINFHRSEAERKLLIGELSHRVKNLYSTINSMARSSMKTGQTAADYVESFTGRLSAMSAAHEKLVDNSWNSVNVLDVVQTVISAHQNSYNSKLVLQIPNLSLDKNLIQTLALCIHELATNAIKYGALKYEKGQVFLRVTRTVVGANFHDVFVWREVGAPPPEIPTQKGFGHRMLESAVRSAGGKIQFDWKDEGFECRFDFVSNIKGG